MSAECEKHKGSQITQICEACKTAFCLDCKAEHDPKHNVYHVQELGQKLILKLGKEDDAVLYQEICKLSDELNAEVSKIKSWYENIERKVIEAVHQSMEELISEVLGSTYTKLNKKKKKMEEGIKYTTEEREKLQDEIKTMIMDEKYGDILKYKDTFFKLIAKQKTYTTAAKLKPEWADHINLIKNLTEDNLKDALINDLKLMFSVPLTYFIPAKTNTLILYNAATKKRSILKMEGIVKSKHFDTVMIKNTIYIAGGLDEDNKQQPLLKNVYSYELFDKENKLTRRSDLIKARYGHKMIAVADQIIYALGGVVGAFYGTKYTNHCEKYDKSFDRWIDTESLTESKSYINACCFRDRYIYVFGGFKDDELTVNSNSVEMLDTMMEKDGWRLIKFEDPSKKWVPFSQGGAIQLGKQNLLLFGGRTSRTQLSGDAFMCNLKDATLKQMDCKLAHPTAFYQRPVMLYKNELYAFDSTDGDIHVFNLSKVKWNIIKKAEWDIN